MTHPTSRLCHALLALLALPLAGFADEPVRLKEGFPAGYQYHVSTRTDLRGNVTIPAMKDKPPQSLAITGESAVEYDERVLEGDGRSAVDKTIRIYRRMDLRRKVGDQPQEAAIRPQVRRLVLLRNKQTEVPFSPDGALTLGELDMVRTDIFTPALTGLLPGRDLRPGEEWTASPQAVAELTDLEDLTEGKVVCKLVEVVKRGERRFAHVSLAGTVRGTNADGPNKQQLDGFFYFDLQSNHLSYLSFSGTSSMLDKDGRALGKIEGTFVLTRRIETRIDDLSDASLRGVKLEPDADNTLLLYREPAFGVEFVHPRRWSVRSADGRQIALDEPGGGGLLITLEPLKQTPTGDQFQAEVAAWLKKQMARVLRSSTVRRDSDGGEQFDFEIEMDRQRQVLDYRVLKQSAGGATFAGRFPSNDAAALQKDGERIARSLKLIPPPK